MSNNGTMDLMFGGKGISFAGADGFEDLKKELDDMGVKNDSYSNNGIIIINRIVMSGEEFDRFTGE